ANGDAIGGAPVPFYISTGTQPTANTTFQGAIMATVSGDLAILYSADVQGNWSWMSPSIAAAGNRAPVALRPAIVGWSRTAPSVSGYVSMLYGTHEPTSGQGLGSEVYELPTGTDGFAWNPGSFPPSPPAGNANSFIFGDGVLLGSCPVGVSTPEG